MGEIEVEAGGEKSASTAERGNDKDEKDDEEKGRFFQFRWIIIF